MKVFRDGRRLRTEMERGAVPGLPLVTRTFGGITLLVVIANVAGGIVVGGLLIALNAGATAHQREVVGLADASYALLAVVLGVVLGFLLQGRTMRWLARERMPTRDEARRALRNPLQLAVVTGALWVVGAIVDAVAAAAVGGTAEDIAGLTGGVILGGLTTAGVSYLIAVNVGRPVTVIALSAYPPTESMLFTLRARMLLIWLLATGIPLLGIVLILSSPPGRTHIVGAGIFAAVIALIVGVTAAALVARAIADPLRATVAVLRRVGQGDLSMTVEVDDVGEIGMLQRGVNEMVDGLRERERIQDLFGRHVGSTVAAEAIHTGVTLRGEAREVVALFVDITGSTALTRRTDPIEFVGMLNRFFAVVVAAVEENGGLVNKFEGDAALCVFGAPEPLADAPTAALRAARQIRDAVYAAGEVEIGIGVAAGPVIAGQIGTASRLEYTVIGDAVNEAARLTELAKRVEGRILASELTVESSAPEEQVYWAKGRVFRLRGRDAPTHSYRSLVTAPVG